MQVIPYKLRLLIPPQDNLKEAILASKLSLKEGDIVALSSKVVSIHEGRSVATNNTQKQKEQLVLAESDWYFKAPKSSKYRRLFTIARGILVGFAGVDESNASEHYILFPKDSMKSAREFQTWFKRTYHIKKLAVIITDSTSTPLRRGSIGFALGWSGFEPLNDYRGTKDLFGRKFLFEMANIADMLACAVVLEMGEGREQQPLAVIRGASNIRFTNRVQKPEPLSVPPEDDLFAPLLWRKGWKRGGFKNKKK